MKQLVPPPLPSKPYTLATLPMIWEYMKPAFTLLLYPQTDSEDNDDTAVLGIDHGYYAGIATITYNFATTMKANIRELYDQLDTFFGEAARSVLLNAPSSQAEDPHLRFLPDLSSRFHHYSRGATTVGHLLNFINRHWIQREVNEGRGWFVVMKIRVSQDTRKAAMRADLKRWGYEEGASSEEMGEAIASAEAGSRPGCIVPIKSLAHRQFRIQVVEPLLSTSEASVDGVVDTAEGSPLGRALEAWSKKLEGSAPKEERERAQQLITSIGHMLKMVGFPPDHPLRVRIKSLV
ncbi:hypothetical protein HETIRDRAFT_415027 [Heterobasidion irregulare TC 32-1]|uniref:Uncharacterized protein n=1 Tax=Heterobasidion irregulare (strain TC 32-1) TaxID=747525 RepID=W4KJM3_HETIT|nr:uncharacterized protein HETIRDRAFT_415027 [Heterobasidion irregulare TC 32-1]ETW86058.1 hypothetical protein HETIRDRAFT_415027 [Heterobasidion irregulare TC 32-1]